MFQSKSTVSIPMPAIRPMSAAAHHHVGSTLPSFSLMPAAKNIEWSMEAHRFHTPNPFRPRRFLPESAVITAQHVSIAMVSNLGNCRLYKRDTCLVPRENLRGRSRPHTSRLCRGSCAKCICGGYYTIARTFAPHALGGTGHVPRYRYEVHTIIDIRKWMPH